MSKNPFNKDELEKIVTTTQLIEGYAKPALNISKETKDIKIKYGIKVQSRK
jgi:hypothetical protein